MSTAEKVFNVSVVVLIVLVAVSSAILIGALYRGSPNESSIGAYTWPCYLAIGWGILIEVVLLAMRIVNPGFLRKSATVHNIKTGQRSA